MRVNCRDCEEGKHGACIGEALVEFEDGTIAEDTCYCSDVQHIPVPDFPDAGETLVIVDPVIGGGVYCCAVCGTPTESEPCREHQPNAFAQATGELYIEAAPTSHRASDVPLWEGETDD
jgi:hypothetical protein